MEKYAEAATKIISEQEQVIGPLAFDLARRAGGVGIGVNKEVSITGDPKSALDNLVKQYYLLFGNTSIEVSKHALRGLKNTFGIDDLPSILK